MIDFFNNFKTAIWLGIISFVSIIIYYLRAIDLEENKDKAKGYIWRKVIIGGVGNIIIVIGVYHLITATTGWDENIILILCAGFGYIGADTIFKLIEKALERYFLNKADKLGGE